MPKQTSLPAALAFCLAALAPATALANPIFVQNGGLEQASTNAALINGPAALAGGRSDALWALSGNERAFSATAIGLPAAAGPAGLFEVSPISAGPTRPGALAGGASSGGQPFALMDGTLAKQVAVPEPATLTVLAMAAILCAGFRLRRTPRA